MLMYDIYTSHGNAPHNTHHYGECMSYLGVNFGGKRNWRIAYYNLLKQNPLRPRFSRLTSSISSFFPQTTRDWNGLPNSTRSVNSIHAFKSLVRGPHRPNIYHRLCFGKREAWLSHIRMGLSALNGQRFQYGLTDSPFCPHCHTEVEDAVHYFQDCHAYRVARTTFYYKLEHTLDIDIAHKANILQTILEGTHISPTHYTTLINCITEYMVDTHRF